MKLDHGADRAGKSVREFSRGMKKSREGEGERKDSHMRNGLSEKNVSIDRETVSIVTRDVRGLELRRI